MYEMIERESVESDSPSTKEISTGKNDLQKIFESATKEDLQDFILSCIKSMDGFRNRFLGHFCGLLEEDPMQQYRQIIRNYAKAAEGQYGFIDYSSARTLIRPLWELNKKADTLRENGEVRESMELSQILIEEMVGLYQNIDDSGGGAGQVVMQAFNTLESIAKMLQQPSKKISLSGPCKSFLFRNITILVLNAIFLICCPSWFLQRNRKSVFWLCWIDK
ncbi:hypothetical protein [Fodinibius sp.]|uniref:hypothetical protein n=1 Tax=Fodinibius sp. TaxID=1872440 RepID=UPI002ACDD801|nr:hypothetical protein [Fodinibius sp.]MDZ7660446.1 hypothetical protein [Fodinibius sp.]